jgi:RNA polymerase sigma factor (sigma-70 family)
LELPKIIEGCIKNNQRCHTRLYNTYRPKLLMVIKKYIKDEDTSEELLQKSFIKIYENLEKYKFTGSFDGWISMITRNLVIDYTRRKKDVLYRSVEVIDNLHLSFNPMEEIELEEDLEKKSNTIKECISLLSPAYRDSFIMYVVENYSHKEIAEALGISVGCSKSNLFKAKNKIRKLLKTK